MTENGNSISEAIENTGDPCKGCESTLRLKSTPAAIHVSTRQQQLSTSSKEPCDADIFLVCEATTATFIPPMGGRSTSRSWATWTELEGDLSERTWNNEWNESPGFKPNSRITEGSLNELQEETYSWWESEYGNEYSSLLPWSCSEFKSRFNEHVATMFACLRSFRMRQNALEAL